MKMHAACTHLLLNVMDDRLPSFSRAKTAEDQGCVDETWMFAIRAVVNGTHSSLISSTFSLDPVKNLQDLVNPVLIGFCACT